MAAVAVTSESEVDRAWNEICRLGLQTYVADLDAHGYTVIPPEIATPNGIAERMLEAVLDVAERRNGERPDLETGSTHAHLGIETTATRRAKGRPKGRLPTGQAASHKGDSPLGDLMQSILPEDPVFEESLMNPVLLAMATYLCGYGVVLSAMGCWMKGPNETTFTMHTDSGGTPEPMPAHAYTCQCAYVLTDYNRENGSTCFVPGSHKWGRKPKGREAILLPYEEGGAEQAVPSVAKAGSMLVWHGHTWHGAFNRTAPGLRVTVTNYMVRPFMRTQEDLNGKIPQEILDRNSARFAIVTQQGVVAGRQSQGDGQAKTARAEKFLAAYAKEAAAA